MRRVELAIEGEPIPKARARVTSRGTFTPKKQTVNAEMLGWRIRIACDHRPFIGPVRVELAFYRKNATRVDVDNLIKQTLDAANGIAWADDRQVVSLAASKGIDRKRPRIEMVIENART